MLRAMVTPAQLRSLCLSMPGAEEKSHFGKADFRVKNKIFAGLTDTPGRGYFKARPELQEELLAARSAVFEAAQGAWGRSGWTYVELPKVELAVLRELVADAWRLVAPAKLVAAQQLAGEGEARPGRSTKAAARRRKRAAG
jgi:predicted DNA-binding protein (MmcQ/YjbR family)